MQFKGEAGKRFMHACAVCCRDQAHAVDTLRYRQRKDAKFNAFISELNSSPLCRKLDLKSFLAMQMMRLTKYPLLIESLLKYTSCKYPRYSGTPRVSTCCSLRVYLSTRPVSTRC